MKIYSVTEVLGRYADFSSIPDPVMAEACQRGQLVHTGCAAHALGAWRKPLAGKYENYVCSFKRWFNANVKQVHLVEQRYTDAVLGYTGQLDLLCELISGAVVVVDIKTPVTESKSWKVQIATYINLAEENGHQPDYGLAIQPKANGNEARAVTYHKNDEDYGIFLCALTAHRNLI